MFTSQQYLELYAALTNPNSSKQANKALMEFEASPDVWRISEELLRSADAAHRLHGYLLISKKLNNPLPPQISIHSIMELLFSLPDMPMMGWLCAAKLLLHLNYPDRQLKWDIAPRQKIVLLRQISSALNQISFEFFSKLQCNTLRKEYFDTNKSLLFSCFRQHSSEVMLCLQSYITNNVKLNSPELLSLLLTFPIDQVAVLLQQIFLHEDYHEQYVEIANYLDKNKASSAIFPVYLAFYRSVNLLQLPTNDMGNVLQTILYFMQKNSQDNQNITISYDMLLKLATDFKDLHEKLQYLPQDKAFIVYSCFLKVWTLVSSRSTLNKMPVIIKQQAEALQIDVDQEDDPSGNLASLNEEQNYHQYQLRNYSCDYLLLSLEVLRNNQQFHQAIFKELIMKSSEDLLAIELVLFILESIAFSLEGSELAYCSEVLNSVLGRANEFNQYLCQRTLIIIGKMNKVLSVQVRILPAILDFIKKALSFKELAPLASQACCQIIEEITVTEDHLKQTQFGSTFQEFLGSIFGNSFDETTPMKVLSNLTKAIVIYLLKFKKTLVAYENFIEAIKNKMNLIKDPSNKHKYLQCLFDAQIWINTQKDVDQFINSFSKFAKDEVPWLLTSCQSSRRKPELTKAIGLINLAIKAKAYGCFDYWLQLINSVLQLTKQSEVLMPVLITPLIQIIRANLNEAQCAALVPLLSKWQPQITNALVKTGTTAPINMLNNIFQLHLEIVKFSQIQPLLPVYRYDPTLIVSYICQIINHPTYWDYEAFRTLLHYFQQLISNGYSPQTLLDSIIDNYRKLSQPLWSQIENILFAIYRQSGMQPLKRSLQRIKSAILPPNPLWTSLTFAFEKEETKKVKNLLLCLQ